MVRFADGATRLSGGSYSNDDDGGNTKSEPEKDNAIVGKKRIPLTPHPSSLKRSKKRSQANDDCNNDHQIEANTRVCIDSHGTDSQNISTKVNKISNQAEYRNERGANTANKAGNKGTTQESKTIQNSSDSKKDENLKTVERGDNSDGANQSKRWKEFVDALDTRSIPNLEAYIKDKASRTETSIRFVNAIDACIQTLRDTTNEIISDVVGPICNQYSERFNDTEENIINTLVSNHSRRNKLLQLMHDADAAWSNKYNKLTAEIMGENQVDSKCEVDADVAGVTGKDIGSDICEKNATLADGGDLCPSNGLVATSVASRNSKERTIFGRDDSDWEELLEYEPSRERVLSFLDERVKRNRTMRIFGESLDNIHSGLENEVEAIFHIALDLYDQHEAMCLEFEDEIEYFIMENYQRRDNLQKELQKSANHAQGLFANLLSRLSQPIS